MIRAKLHAYQSFFFFIVLTKNIIKHYPSAILPTRFILCKLAVSDIQLCIHTLRYYILNDIIVLL